MRSRLLRVLKRLPGYCALSPPQHPLIRQDQRQQPGDFHRELIHSQAGIGGSTEVLPASNPGRNACRSSDQVCSTKSISDYNILNRLLVKQMTVRLTCRVGAYLIQGLTARRIFVFET